MVHSYEPKPFAGRMMVIRSSREPMGRFLDKKLGWGEFANGGVEPVVIPGDHWSVFRDPGVSLIAQHIEAAVLADFGNTRPFQVATLWEP